MSEEAKAAQETAKAVQRVAETTDSAIERVSQLVEYIGNVLDTTPHDAIGVLGGDFLKHWRVRNLAAMLEKTTRILRERGVEHFQPISPNLAIPAFQAASDQGDETIQDLWASLMANAMDPNRDVSLKHMFIETLRAFHPIDAVILDRHVSMGPHGKQNIGHVASEMKMRFNEILLSAQHLESLGCLARPHGSNLDERLVVRDLFVPTALGQELWRAVKDNGED